MPRAVDPHRSLTAALEAYARCHPGDPVAARFRRFLADTPTALARSRLRGHVTASAWVVDRAARAAVLIFHPQLERWLQPGGHLEAGEDTVQAADREAREETGLSSLNAAAPAIFDLDVHLIPERPGEPAHLHWDVRHVVEACATEIPRPTEEIRTAVWVPWAKIAEKTNAQSVLRLARRVQADEPRG